MSVVAATHSSPSRMSNRAPAQGWPIGASPPSGGGLEVKLGSRRAFCPASQVDRNFSEDLSHHVGQSYAFLITRYDPTGRRIVVSRRAFLESEAKEAHSYGHLTAADATPDAREGAPRDVLPWTEATVWRFARDNSSWRGERWCSGGCRCQVPSIRGQRLDLRRSHERDAARGGAHGRHAYRTRAPRQAARRWANAAAVPAESTGP